MIRFDIKNRFDQQFHPVKSFILLFYVFCSTCWQGQLFTWRFRRSVYSSTISTTTSSY